MNVANHVTTSPLRIGRHRHHPVAAAFADVVRRVHHRYATELVGAFRLCPFMNDPESAFGTFVVVLDPELDIDMAMKCVLGAPGNVIHLIYPLAEVSPVVFERFGSAVHQAVASATDGGPVHATFHPTMEGDTTSAAKLVGLVRRAPDPFIQFVPEGLHKGGSTFLDVEGLDLAKLLSSSKANDDNASGNYARLGANDFSRIEAIISDVRAERDRSYAEFLHAMANA